MSYPNLANGWTSTLSGAIDTDDTTVDVAATAGMPSRPFQAVILAEGANSDEIVTVTNLSSSTITITRATEANAAGSSSASSHASGATISHVLTAGSLLAITRGYALDEYQIDATYGDDFTAGSLSGSWTRRNYTSGAETYQLGGRASFIRIAKTGRTNGDGYFRTAPGGDFTIAMKYIPRFFYNLPPAWGLAVIDSSGNGVASGFYGTSPNALILASVTTYTTYGSTYVQPGASGTNPNVSIFGLHYLANDRPVWVYVRKSSTSYYTAFSWDGEVWGPESAALTWSGTVDRIGMMDNVLGYADSGSGTGSYVDVDWFNKIA